MFFSRTGEGTGKAGPSLQTWALGMGVPPGRRDGAGTGEERIADLPPARLAQRPGLLRVLGASFGIRKLSSFPRRGARRPAGLVVPHALLLLTCLSFLLTCLSFLLCVGLHRAATL